MSYLNHILHLLQPHLLPVALALATLAFLASLIILERRLRRSSRSCEGQTSPDHSQSCPYARTDPSLPSTIPHSGEHAPAHPPVQAKSPQEDNSEDAMPRRPRQPYDAFLVLDVEATCMEGAGFDYPNEIIASRYLNVSVYAHPDREYVCHRSGPSVFFGGKTSLPKAMRVSSRSSTSSAASSGLHGGLSYLPSAML